RAAPAFRGRCGQSPPPALPKPYPRQRMQADNAASKEGGRRMFSSQSADEIAAAARSIGVEPAALLAVAEVESGGRASTLIDGKAEPLIRFEGHYFDRRLSGENRALARAAGLASPTPGAVANPPTQASRWRMLTRAAAIDRKAAYES